MGPRHLEQHYDPKGTTRGDPYMLNVSDSQLSKHLTFDCLFILGFGFQPSQTGYRDSLGKNSVQAWVPGV